MAMWCKLLLGVGMMLVFGSAARGQDQPLLIVGNDTTTAGEFLYSYRKNRSVRVEGGDTLSLRAFLVSYTDYRLKVVDAVRMRLDTGRQFRQEYQRYRNSQLASLILDSAAVEAGYRAAYDRMRREVDVSHILVAVTAERNDSAALRKARQLRREVMRGRDFSEVASQESDDFSTRPNGGRLGYFTAFTMVAPFELAAYATKVGGISEPVRSQYGYHVIKVHGDRPARGSVQVAHILVRVPEDAGFGLQDSAHAMVVRAYEEAQRGVDFFSLMDKYSPETAAASAGGRYPWVSAGRAPEWFLDRVFSLRADGDVSEPFRSSLGWHIVKRLAFAPILPYNQAREQLHALMQRSGIAVDDDAAFAAAARRIARAEQHDSVAQVLEEWARESRRGDSLPFTLEGAQIGMVAGRRVGVRDFCQWAEGIGVDLHGTRPGVVRHLVGQCIDALAVDFALEVVSRGDRRFAYLIREFHDGLLLFDVSDRKVWASGLTKEEDLKAYYDANRDGLFFDTCYIVEEYSTAERGVLDPVAEKFFSNSKAKLSQRAMRKKGIRLNTLRLGSDHPLMHGFKGFGALGFGKRGDVAWHGMCLGPMERRGAYKLYRVVKRSLREPMGYEESRPLMYSRMQADRERAWVAQLRSAVRVEVKEDALKWVEDQIHD